MTAGVRLFVYGTLMRGEHADALLEAAHFHGPAATAAGYVLHDMGPYPAMAAGGAGVVAGELYSVEAALLARLDDYEGVPTYYQRLTVRLSDGSEAQAYMIEAGRLAAHPAIPCGNWRKRKG